MSDRPLICYFGHHKCASTWIHSILDAVCADAGWRLAYLYDERNFDEDLPAYVREREIDVVSYVNADRRFVAGLPPFRGFHVVRDPRDIVVSGYFSHRKTHPTTDWPELPPHRDKLNALPKEEGLLEEMVFSGQWLDEMMSWDYEQEHVLELKQETFTTDPYRGFLTAFGFLGILDEDHLAKRRLIPLLGRMVKNILWRQGKWPVRKPFDRFPAERLLGIVHDNRFSNYAGGRKKGEADESSHYRKGQAGDWRNHFTPEHVERFKELYNPLLLRLGYETSPDWSLETATVLGPT